MSGRNLPIALVLIQLVFATAHLRRSLWQQQSTSWQAPWSRLDPLNNDPSNLRLSILSGPSPAAPLEPPPAPPQAPAHPFEPPPAPPAPPSPPAPGTSTAATSPLAPQQSPAHSASPNGAAPSPTPVVIVPPPVPAPAVQQLLLPPSPSQFFAPLLPAAPSPFLLPHVPAPVPTPPPVAVSTPAPTTTTTVPTTTTMATTTTLKKRGKALMEKLRSKGSPSCRQYPLRQCQYPLNHITNTAMAACVGGDEFYRSSTAANWFYAYFPARGFALDVAAGCSGLGKTLPPQVQYISAAKFNCDYNDGLIPKLSNATATNMSGVVLAVGILEQVCDVASFLEALKSYYLPLVISYAPIESNSAEDEATASTRANALTTGQFRQVLKNLEIGQPRHEARVNLDGAAHLLYWFDPIPEWTPFTRP